MDEDEDHRPRTPAGPRRKRGFEPAGGLLRAPIRKAGETRGFAASRLLTHWDEIAGPELATLCRPLKVSYAEAGMGATLTVSCTGAAAPLVQMNLPKLRERVNACYGYAAIARVRVTQTRPCGMEDAQAPFTRPGTNIAAPSAESLDRARQVIGGLTEGMTDTSLKRALERLAENVLTRQKGAGGH